MIFPKWKVIECTRLYFIYFRPFLWQSEKYKEIVMNRDE